MPRTKSRRRPLRTNGYGSRPKKYFKLAPHQAVLDVPPFHKFGYVAEKMSEGGFPLLRDPQGRPVVRWHSDLDEHEVSLVLR